ncbi:MAG: hypothetical protein R3B48_24310 [Kofleriaceae bacterium]
MRTTKLLAFVLLAAAACQQEGPPKFQFSKDVEAPAAASGDLATRVAALEAEAAKNKEALEFLNQVFAQQKKASDEEERRTAAPDAVFAIGITGNAVDGPATAAVTLVEAWDFA